MIYNGKTLTEALRTVLQAINEDEYRQYLDGIHWNITESKLTLTGTDGFILIETTVPCASEIQATALLCQEDMRQLAVILRVASPAQVEIEPADTTWAFCFNGNRFTAAVINVEVPNYEKAIAPKNDEGGSPWITAAFLSAVLKYAPELCKIETQGRLNQVLITGHNYRAVVMPVAYDGARAALESEAGND